MQSTALIRTLALALVFANLIPQAVFAGHEELIQQHRFMRAELSGVLYLPGNQAVADAPLVPETSATIITASKTCEDRAGHSCATTATNP